MIEYFHTEEVNIANKQRKKTLGVYLITLAVYLVFFFCMMIWYWFLPYKHPQIKVVKWILYPISIFYMIFSYMYLFIRYGRIRRYYNLCCKMVYGNKEVYVGEFLRYENSIEQKDGVDFKSLIFKEWNKYKNNFFERKVLVFYEKDFPEITEKAVIEYTVQGNVLLNYKYLNSQGE